MYVLNKTTSPQSRLHSCRCALISATSERSSQCRYYICSMIAAAAPRGRSRFNTRVWGGQIAYITISV